MLKMPLRSICFVVLLAALLWGTDQVLLYGLRKKEVGDFGVWNKLVDGHINADILICGSSRALVGVDPAVLTRITGHSAYNIAVDGSHPNLQRPWLDIYLQNNRAPKVIVQTVDLSSMDLRSNPYHPWQYVPYLGWDVLYENLVALEPSFRWHKYLPMYSFSIFPGLTLRSVRSWLGLFDPKLDFRHNGFKPTNWQWSEEFMRYRATNPHGVYEVIRPEARAVLDQIAGLARRAGSRIVFVFIPEYHENHVMVKNRTELFKAFQQLADDHQVPFWDYSDWPESRSIAYFYNSQHLNLEGARLFSELLGYDLKIWLEKYD